MPPPAVKAVLFDLDDTLWPILPVIQRAEKALYGWLEAHAPRVSQRYSIADLRQRRMELMAAHARYQFDLVALRRAGLAEAFAEVGEGPHLIEPALQVFQAERNRVECYEDVLPALARLGKSYRLGSVTNGASDLDAIGIAEHFHAAVAAHAFGSAKPDPQIFLAGCAALGVSPDEAVFVGDDPLLDVRGAQQAGLRAVWINRAERVLPPDVAPDAVCASLEELEAWLAQQARPRN